MHNALRYVRAIAAAAVLGCLGAGLAAAQTTTTDNPFGGSQDQAPSTEAPKRVRAGARPQSLGPGQYATEAAARTACGSDEVVWANTATKVYHRAGFRGYGTTRRGAYMCLRDTAAAGIRAAKNEKR